MILSPGGSSVPEFPQPPVDMVMPQHAQVIATIGLWVPAMVMFVAAAVYWRRGGSPVYLLGMVGGDWDRRFLARGRAARRLYPAPARELEGSALPEPG